MFLSTKRLSDCVSVLYTTLIPSQNHSGWLILHTSKSPPSYSYDAPNGVPSCANEALQVELLQKRFGLAGPVVTDCGAIGLFFKQHNFSADAGAMLA